MKDWRCPLVLISGGKSSVGKSTGGSFRRLKVTVEVKENLSLEFFIPSRHAGASISSFNESTLPFSDVTEHEMVSTLL